MGISLIIIRNNNAKVYILILKNSIFCRLRALSSGGSVTSPPPSPAMPKYKLAEYRYGREEMLALYIKDNKVSMRALLQFPHLDRITRYIHFLITSIFDHL